MTIDHDYDSLMIGVKLCLFVKTVMVIVTSHCAAVSCPASTKKCEF